MTRFLRVFLVRSRMPSERSAEAELEFTRKLAADITFRARSKVWTSGGCREDDIEKEEEGGAQ